MALREICRFRDGAYRIVQEDGQGGPWVEYLDPQEGPQRAANEPEEHFRALEAELAAALGQLRAERRVARRELLKNALLEEQNEALRESLEGMGSEIEKIRRKMRA